MIEVTEFIAAYQKKDPNVSERHLCRLFEDADLNDSGRVDFDQFLKGKSLNMSPNTFVASLGVRANSHVLFSSVSNAKPNG